ncbi:MAG: tetratricopeptide repeat protein [Pseudomonadota bacterium]
MRFCSAYTLMVALVAVAALPAAPAAQAKGPTDPRALIEQAVPLLQQGQYALGRAYLAPALPHPQLSAAERAHAYYLRGASYLQQRLFVSARKDFHRALEFNARNAAAQTSLADLYRNGLGVAQDVPLALTLYSEAAELGESRAQINLGQAYITGTGVEQDLAEGRRWLAPLAEDGNATAMVHLAASYRDRYTAEPQPQLALSWYDQAIDRNDPGAMVAKAYMLRTGEAGRIEGENVLLLLERAAQLEHPHAVVLLSNMYLEGEFVASDAQRAYALLEQASAAPSGEVLLRLGHHRQYGLGTAVDRSGAIDAYTRAAALGEQRAMSRLAQLLLRNEDEVSHRRAGQYLAQAAASEAPGAQNDYAWYLATHPLASLRDGARALSYAQAAVAQNATPGYLDTLAAAYAELGNFELAVRTQKQAIERANADAPELVDELKDRLQRFEARKPWRSVTAG